MKHLIHAVALRAAHERLNTDGFTIPELAAAANVPEQEAAKYLLALPDAPRARRDGDAILYRDGRAVLGTR